MEEIKGPAEQKDIRARAIKLADLIAYQTGSVVSRQLISRPAGTVTIFAFEQGEGLSEHTAPFDAMVYILEGEAQITIGGQSQTVKASEMIIMPANQSHSLQAAERFKMLLIMIKS